MNSIKCCILQEVLCFLQLLEGIVLQLLVGYSSATVRFNLFGFVYLVLVLVLGSDYDLRQILGIEYHITHMLSAKHLID